MRWDAIVADWEKALRPISGITLRRLGPVNAGTVPYLSMEWDHRQTGFTRDEYITRLRHGEPRIELWPTPDRGLCATPFMLVPGDEKIVARRLAEVFRSFPASTGFDASSVR